MKSVRVFVSSPGDTHFERMRVERVVERLNGEMTKILKAKEMEERLQGDGVSPSGGTPEQLAEQIRKEIEQWRQVVTRAGVKIN